jgi:hypothetical protein
MDNAIRIVLAEDQSIVRQGLRYIIDAQPGPLSARLLMATKRSRQQYRRLLIWS